MDPREAPLEFLDQRLAAMQQLRKALERLQQCHPATLQMLITQLHLRQVEVATRLSGASSQRQKNGGRSRRHSGRTSQQALSNILRREAVGAVSIENLRRIAAAIGFELCYYYVPLEQTVKSFKAVGAQKRAPAKRPGTRS